MDDESAQELKAALLEQALLVTLAQKPEHAVKTEINEFLLENRGFINQVELYINLPIHDEHTTRNFAQRLRMANDKLFAAMEPSGGDTIQ